MAIVIGVLHGGVYASLICIGSLTVARNALKLDKGFPIHSSMVQVQYLAAAMEEDVFSESTVLRTGKVICFVETSVFTKKEKKKVAQGFVTLSCNNEPNDPLVPFGEHVRKPEGLNIENPNEENIAIMGQVIDKSVPFIGHLGMKTVFMSNSKCAIYMRHNPSFADEKGTKGGSGVGGYVHEGAITALLDTCGAMASWAATNGNPRYQASTISLQANHIRQQQISSSNGLIAYGEVLRREADLFWTAVEVYQLSNGDGSDDQQQQQQQQIARGTVLYRIVGASAGGLSRKKKAKI